MIRRLSLQQLSWVLSLALAAFWLACTGYSAVGQEKKDAAEPRAAKAAGPQAREFRGRLPAHYGEVVDQKQREAIYKIQEEYAAKLDALKAQLAALTKQRDDRIEALLTPEQRKKIDDLKKAKPERKREKSAPVSRD